MKFLSSKLSVYLTILTLGGGLGFLGSRYWGQSSSVQQSQMYPVVVPTKKNLVLRQLKTTTLTLTLSPLRYRELALR